MIDWFNRSIRKVCERCPPDDEASPAERRYEIERVKAERMIRWADRITREIQDRPSWEDLLLRERK